MTENHVKFGYHYQAGNVLIKLRLVSSKFFAVGMDKMGEYRTVKNGYVVFEALVPQKSKSYWAVEDKLRAYRTAQV